MAKKFFVILDTETTQTDKVADLGIVVCDKQGNIAYEMGVMIADFYCNAAEHPLFHVFGDANDVFSKASLPARRARYDAMIKDGTRLVSSVGGVNRLLAKIKAKYNPVLTAYNLAFDVSKLNNSGVILDAFDTRFCLWHAAAHKWGATKAYKDFILQGGHFGARTKLGNLGFSTKADQMAAFIIGGDLPPEPHTALEDARDYERPILTALVKSTLPKDYMNAPAYNWRNFQVRDHFKAA